MSYQVHNFQTGDVIEAAPVNEMDAQIQLNEQNINSKIPASQKGAANGVAELDSSGKVPSSQLPSYVDDVLEYDSLSAFPATGEAGKIYVAKDTNRTYRWSGSGYVEISQGLTLGETSSTAYRGDRGKTAYDHATESGKVSSAVTEGLYKVGVTGQGHVASVSAIEKSDITGLGILDANQGSENAGKYMKVDTDGSLVPSHITEKADKVSGATSGNFAGLDANGNLIDSGSKASDFLTQHQDISGKLDKDQGSANAGKYMRVGSGGLLTTDKVNERYASMSGFPVTGDVDKIYIAEDNGRMYVWDSSNNEYLAVGGSGGSGGASNDNIAEEYDSTKTYNEGDYVFHSDKLYKANQDITVAESWDGSHWTETTVAEEFQGKKDLQTAVTDPTASGTDIEFIAGITQNEQGVISPSKKTVRTMTGATSSANGTSGVVPAPLSGEHMKVLTGNGEWETAPGARIIQVETTVTNTSGSYTTTVADDRISADMKAISLEIANPYVFNGKITVSCSEGSVTLSCPDVTGTTTVKINIIKADLTTSTMTSEEFDILNDSKADKTTVDALEARVDMLDPELQTALFTDVNFSIAVNSWTLNSNNGRYEYTFSNSLILEGSGIDVNYDESLRNSLTGDIGTTKATGSVTFSTSRLPVGVVSGVVRIISSTTGIIPVPMGGTGGITPKAARLNLNVPIRDIYVSFGTVSSLPQTVYDSDLTADMVAFDAVFGNPAAIPTGIDVTFAAGSVTITGTLVSGASTTISFWAHEKRGAAEGSEEPGTTQRVQDYVQTNAQTLTVAQKAQVQTNLGLGGAAVADIVDNLTTDDATKVLSAKQGKALDNNKAAKIFLTSSDDTWAKIWAKISVLNNGDCGTIYINNTPWSIITGGARTSGAPSGTIARSSSSEFKFVLNMGSNNPMYVYLSGASSSSAGTYSENDVNASKFDSPTLISITNNSSGSFTLLNSKQYLLITNGYANNGRDISLICVGGSGTVRITHFASSADGISYDTQTANKITISNSSGQGLKAYLFLLG